MRRDDLDVPVTTEHGYISDATSFEQIIWEFEQKEPGQPLLLFNVTIQNHGSYTVADYPAEVTVTDYPGQFPKAEQYLTLANKSDEAFQMLVDYFSTYEEPTIILMFGDHQPSVEQEFLDLVYNVGDDGMSMEEYMRKYEVPYLIWANYDLPQMELPTTSLNFLGQQLLQSGWNRNHRLWRVPLGRAGDPACHLLPRLYRCGGQCLQPPGDQRLHPADRCLSVLPVQQPVRRRGSAGCAL